MSYSDDHLTTLFPSMTLSVDNMTIEFEKVPRWINASINKHFLGFRDIIKQDQIVKIVSEVPLFIEGTDRQTSNLEDFAELRINGPLIKECSKGYFDVDVMVNVIIQSKMNNEDIYKHQRDIGTLLKAFTDHIDVFKYGDDSSFFGCLVMRTDQSQKIDITNFGQIDPAIRLLQSVVAAEYRMNLTDMTKFLH